MKIGFIGCVQSSAKLLETLLQLESNLVDVVGVVTLNSSAINADHYDLAPICRRHNIPYCYHDGSDKEKSRKFLEDLRPDVIYCFGWSYLLDRDMLALTSLGVIGFHPAKLPQNRGRHPIIWALALGLDETASTFFKMDAGADSGPILSQVDIPISTHDNANSLYKKILSTAQKQVREFTIALASGEGELSIQDESRATYWRKRSRKDGMIDWRMHAGTIHNLIRALSHPYPGAEFIYRGQSVLVWDSELVGTRFEKTIEPGQVIDVTANCVLVKCAEDTALAIKNFSPEINLIKGEYL